MGGGSRAVGYQLLAHALQGHALFIPRRVQFTQATHRIQIGTGKSASVYESVRGGETNQKVSWRTRAESLSEPHCPRGFGPERSATRK